MFEVIAFGKSSSNAILKQFKIATSWHFFQQLKQKGYIYQ